MTTVKNDQLTIYKSGENEIKLSPAIIRRYFDPSGKCSEQEVGMFLALCKYQALNPFLREVYLIKYGDNPATMVVGKEAFLKRAVSCHDYNGYEIEMIDDKDGKPAAARCRVYRKGIERPASDVTVYMDEYYVDNAKTQWPKRRRTMLRKTALVQALREAFPMMMGGLYSEDEMPVGENAGKGPLPTAPIVDAEFETQELLPMTPPQAPEPPKEAPKKAAKAKLLQQEPKATPADDILDAVVPMEQPKAESPQSMLKRMREYRVREWGETITAAAWRIIGADNPKRTDAELESIIEIMLPWKEEPPKDPCPGAVPPGMDVSARGPIMKMWAEEVYDAYQEITR